jgi:hypothetical protein
VRTHERHDAEIWVPLAQIRISTRRRRGLSSATVERYREWLEQGREAPAVRLARDGDGFVIRDGRHRVAAALAAGHAVVKAELRRIAGWFGRRASPLALACIRRSVWGRGSGGGAPRLHRGGAGSTPAVSTSRLRSVNGKHTPFVRPKCGFDSCRRLLASLAGGLFQAGEAGPPEPA